LRSGQLVDDQTVIDVVKQIHKDPKFSDAKGIILDGVPRTVNQADKLKDILNVDLLLNFFNREEILL
jgi:adenylate kinase family enzyme